LIHRFVKVFGNMETVVNHFDMRCHRPCHIPGKSPRFFPKPIAVPTASLPNANPPRKPSNLR
jgi:hypothetical protein